MVATKTSRLNKSIDLASSQSGHRYQRRFVVRAGPEETIGGFEAPSGGADEAVSLSKSREGGGISSVGKSPSRASPDKPCVGAWAEGGRGVTSLRFVSRSSGAATESGGTGGLPSKTLGGSNCGGTRRLATAEFGPTTGGSSARESLPSFSFTMITSPLERLSLVRSSPH